MIHRRTLYAAALAAATWFTLPFAAHAADEAPDALIKRLSTDVLDTVRADPSIQTGEVGKVVALVDQTILPHINFRRMTAAAVGPAWRKATPEQKERLQAEFKTLLVRTYSGALSQVTDQTIVIKPMRHAPDDKDVVVRTEIRGGGEPVQLDYRLEKTPGDGAGWKVYNLNVLGVWLVDTYRSQFAQQINAAPEGQGIEQLIESLAARNKTNNEKS